MIHLIAGKMRKMCISFDENGEDFSISVEFNKGTSTVFYQNMQDCIYYTLYNSKIKFDKVEFYKLNNCVDYFFKTKKLSPNLNWLVEQDNDYTS